jgi:GGDEF domain-containing protein
LLIAIEKKIDNITHDSSTIFFQELSKIFNLLSLGLNFNILNDYNNYNYDDISTLFRTYEGFLGELHAQDKALFEITFLHYITLIETFHKLCIINSTDIQRKKTIPPILDLLTETNNMVKFTVPLDEDKIKILNNIIGKQLYYYTHITYIDTNNLEIEKVFTKYQTLIEKQKDGFELSLETNFGGNNEAGTYENIIFKTNVSFLLLNLINKLKNQFNIQNITMYPKLREMILVYDKNYFNPDLPYDTSLDGIIDALLNSFTFKYMSDLDKSSTVLNNYIDALNHFIQSDNQFEPITIESIHNILLFAPKIDKMTYINIAEILLTSQKIANDIYEFYKLKTLDVILNKLMENYPDNTVDDLIDQILRYITINKIASNLMSAFSKIYLTISLYYSTKTDSEDFAKAREFYHIFINTNGFNLLNGVYNNIFHTLLLNFGKTYSYILGLDNIVLTNDQYENISQKLIDEYVVYKDLELRYKINTDISHLVNDILNKDGMGDEIINAKISDFISEKLFYGLCKITIKGLSKQEIKINQLKQNGYEVYSLDVVDEFAILFIYPKVYKESFEYIFKANQLYIEENIQNILLGYIKNRSLYIDKITGLDNLHKLNKDILRLKEDQSVTFMEINIATLEQISKEISYKHGNNYLVTVVKKLISVVQANGRIYRLSGLKIGVLIIDNQELVTNAVIQALKNLYIKVDEHNIKSRFNIGMVQSLPKDILNKSYNALKHAMRNKQFISIIRT